MLRHVWWDGRAWNNEPLASPPLGGGPAAMVDFDGSIQVFAAGTDHSLQHIWWDGDGWNAEPLGGGIA
ncbi:hypothetical protein ACFY2R_26425 [Micromonospora olivasterospora]|nr:hypothetical protein [Micromonospora olivasterospora]